MKTLNDVQNDMAELFESVKAGKTEQKTADTLANITGKWLKAEDLKHCIRVFESRRRLPSLPHNTDGSRTALPDSSVEQ